MNRVGELVERLRVYAGPRDDIHKEAADMIEKLQARIKTLEADKKSINFAPVVQRKRQWS